MSLYLQTLSEEDRDTLLRPDIPPSIHPNWLPETSPDKEVEHVCIISDNLSRDKIDWDQQAPRIHRRDLEDLRRIWLRVPDQRSDIQNLLRGYWTVDNWGSTGTEHTVILLQYKTLRVCVRGGSGPVVIGTTDIDNILYLCVEWATSEEVPQCVGNVLFNNHMLQWLLLPVERHGDAGLEAYIRHFREGQGRCRENPNLDVTKKKILAELGGRFRNLKDRNAQTFMGHLKIKEQDVRTAMFEIGRLRTGYETLGLGALEQLVRVYAAKFAGSSDDPYPLPLTIGEPQAERILELQEEMVELVEQRENEDFKNKELHSLISTLPWVQEELSTAFSRYVELVKEKNRAVFQQYRGEQDSGQDADSDISRYHLPRDLFSGSSGPSALPQYMSTSTLDHSSNAQQANTISGGFHQLPPSGGYVSGHQRQYHGHYNNEYDGGEPSGGHHESYLPEESSLPEADPCEDEDEHDEYYNTGYGGGGSSRQQYSSQQ